MIKSIVFFKRKPGMSVGDFQAYWLARHPDVVTRLPGIRRYVQSHTLPSIYTRRRSPMSDTSLPTATASRGTSRS